MVIYSRFRKMPPLKSKSSGYDFRRLANVFSNPNYSEAINPSSSKDEDIDSVGDDIVHAECVIDDTSEHLRKQSRSSDTDFEQVTPIISESRINIDTGSSSASCSSNGPSVSGNRVLKSRPRRAKFSVPFKKKIRGKCSKWENCPNCTIENDCGLCRYCTDKTLQ